MDRYIKKSLAITEDITMDVSEYSISHGINAQLITTLNGMCLLQNNGVDAIFLRLKGNIYTVCSVAVELDYILRNGTLLSFDFNGMSFVDMVLKDYCCSSDENGTNICELELTGTGQVNYVAI